MRVGTVWGSCLRPAILSTLESTLSHSHPHFPAGRIFEFVHCEDVTPPLIDGQVLPQIIQVLLEAIKDQPHIAEKVRLGITGGGCMMAACSCGRHGRTSKAGRCNKHPVSSLP